MVAELMRWCGTTLQELAGVCIGAGPGSYTGLRIGVSVAKSLCYGAQIPLIGLSSLTSMIAGRQGYDVGSGWWCALLDAGAGHAYGMLADNQGCVVAGPAKYVVHAAAFQPWLEQGTVYFLGSGASLHADKLLTHPHSRVIHGVYPQASAMGLLAYERLQAGATDHPASFEPCYL